MSYQIEDRTEEWESLKQRWWWAAVERGITCDERLALIANVRLISAVFLAGVFVGLYL